VSAIATLKTLFSFSILDDLAELRATLRAEAARRRSYARTVAELEGLSDADLRDIGISRHDIAAAAYEKVWGGRAA
jgi:uncharacterized protein YjiS (DUF1127 family)